MQLHLLETTVLQAFLADSGLRKAWARRASEENLLASFEWVERMNRLAWEVERVEKRQLRAEFFSGPRELAIWDFGLQHTPNLDSPEIF